LDIGLSWLTLCVRVTVDGFAEMMRKRKSGRDRLRQASVATTVGDRVWGRIHNMSETEDVEGIESI
jgi:hypothetical protein